MTEHPTADTPPADTPEAGPFGLSAELAALPAVPDATPGEMLPLDGVLPPNATLADLKALDTPPTSPDLGDTPAPALIRTEPSPVELEALDGLAQRVTEHRRLLGQRATNLDDQNRPHFLRNVDGDERCGQCGEPWECPSYAALREEAAGLPTVDGQPSSGLSAVDAAAAELGLDPQALRLAVDQYARRR